MFDLIYVESDCTLEQVEKLPVATGVCLAVPESFVNSTFRANIERQLRLKILPRFLELTGRDVYAPSVARALEAKGYSILYRYDKRSVAFMKL